MWCSHVQPSFKRTEKNDSEYSTSIPLPRYNVFAGSNIGHIKGVSFCKKSYCNLSQKTLENFKPARYNGINCLCWGDKDESSLFAGLVDGGVFKHFLRTEISNYVKVVREDGDGQMKSIKKHESNLLCAFSNGIIKMFDLNDDTDSSSDIFPSLTINSFLDGEQKHLECMDHNVSIPNTLVAGGNESSIKVWDVNAPETPVFTAKNVKNDWLNLRVPVWFTNVQFYPESSKIVSATGYGHVRLYDPSSSQRRPVIEVKCGEHPISALCVRPNSDFEIFIGDTTGFVASVDLRKKATIKTFKGTKGGITDIAAHPKYPIFVASSVDRFVYCYDADNSRDLIHSVYLKNSLNCILCSSSWKQEDYGKPVKARPGNPGMEKASSQSADSDYSDAEEEKEDLWDTMEVVGDKKRKAENPEVSKKAKAIKK